jgi:hypothetical protein
MDENLNFSIAGFLFTVTLPKDKTFNISSRVRDGIEKFPMLDIVDQHFVALIIKTECNEYEQAIIFNAINKIREMIEHKNIIISKACSDTTKQPFYNKIQKVTDEHLKDMEDKDLKKLLNIFMDAIIFNVIDQSIPMINTSIH